MKYSRLQFLWMDTTGKVCLKSSGSNSSGSSIVLWGPPKQTLELTVVVRQKRKIIRNLTLIPIHRTANFQAKASSLIKLTKKPV